MTPHLEKIARAIYAEFAERNPTEGATFDNMYPEARAELINVARICVAALLPPSEEMSRAMEAAARAADQSWATGDKLGWDQVEVAFTAAIQSILTEGEGA